MEERDERPPVPQPVRLGPKLRDRRAAVPLAATVAAESRDELAGQGHADASLETLARARLRPLEAREHRALLEKAFCTSPPVRRLHR